MVDLSTLRGSSPRSCESTTPEPHGDPPTRHSHLFLALRTVTDGSWWDNPATTEVRWTTLREWVCSCQRPQPSGRTSQRCLLLQQGPGAMDPGLRQWAQPEKMQGNKQRVGNNARLTWLAQQLSITVEQVKGKTLQTFLQCNRRAEHNCETRTKQRLRMPNIATALVRLNPDLARSATKRPRWLTS